MPKLKIKKALLIDDNPIDRFVHQRMLTHAQVVEEVEQAESGKQALAILNACLDAPEKAPGLILLDLMMPEMDGFEFLKHYDLWLKKFTGSTPSLYMVSSTEDEYDLNRARQNPHIIRLLRKPLAVNLIGE